MIKKSTISRVGRCLRWAVAAGLAAGLSTPVLAANEVTPDYPSPPAAASKKPKKAAKPKSPKAAKVKFMPGSEETRAERRARLKIECKGAANAGVCTGYALP